MVIETAGAEAVEGRLALRVVHARHDLLAALGHHAPEALQVAHVDLRGRHRRDAVVDREHEHEGEVVGAAPAPKLDERRPRRRGRGPRQGRRQPGKEGRGPGGQEVDRQATEGGLVGELLHGIAHGDWHMHGQRACSRTKRKEKSLDISLDLWTRVSTRSTAWRWLSCSGDTAASLRDEATAAGRPGRSCCMLHAQAGSPEQFWKTIMVQFDDITVIGEGWHHHFRQLVSKPWVVSL